MSDILLVIPSEIWGAIQMLLKKNGGSSEGVKIWGDGHKGETLLEFLDKTLSEMAYDEKVHILTGVQDVRYTSRCPYSNQSKGHKECGWLPCTRCGRGDWAHPDIPGIKPHEYEASNTSDVSKESRRKKR